jgi:hypothetical protein
MTNAIRPRPYAVEKLPAWQRLVAEEDLANLAARFDDARDSVLSRHVKDLLDLFRVGSDTERLRAFVVVRGLAEKDDKRLREGDRLSFMELVRETARSEYPKTRVGWATFEYLRRVEGEQARLIVEAVDILPLNDEERREIVQNALWFNSPRINEILRQAKELGGESGNAARRHLERRGLGDPDVIEALAAEWRKTRSPEALHALYVRYLSHMAGKITIGQIVRMMGRPDARDSDSHSVWYKPNEWTSLYLHGDSKGVLRTMKIT